MRTGASSVWWRTCHWTGRFYRRSSQKNSKAPSTKPVGEMGTGGLPDLTTAGGAFGAGSQEYGPIPAQGCQERSVAHPDPGVGEHLCTVRIPQAHGHAATRRLGSERQAVVPAVRRGRIASAWKNAKA